MINRFASMGGNSLRLMLGVMLLSMIGAATMNIDAANAEAKANPVITMDTTKGPITIELYADKAPKSVENFLWYVDHEFFDGLIFHRVIPNFMIQGGGFTKDMVKKSTNPAIVNEADNGLKNERGTLAMARTNDVNSATAQFFINLVDNNSLNFTGKSNSRTWGYAVFGKVIDGMEVVDEIAKVKTTTKGQYQNVPATAVVIQKAYRAEKTKKEKDKK